MRRFKEWLRVWLGVEDQLDEIKRLVQKQDEVLLDMHQSIDNVGNDDHGLGNSVGQLEHELHSEIERLERQIDDIRNDLED